MDKITTGGQGPKMGRSKDLYRYYSVRRAAKGVYVYMGRGPPAVRFGKVPVWS